MVEHLGVLRLKVEVEVGPANLDSVAVAQQEPCGGRRRQRHGRITSALGEAILDPLLADARQEELRRHEQRGEDEDDDADQHGKAHDGPVPSLAAAAGGLCDGQR